MSKTQKFSRRSVLAAGAVITGSALFHLRTGDHGTGTLASTRLLLGATTTTRDSGLLQHLIGAFRQTYEQASATRVHTVVQGSGAVLNLARRGDLDAVLVHDPAQEQVFVGQGHAVSRREVMYNHFLLVGPGTFDVSAELSADDADMGGSVDAVLKTVRQRRLPFLSRGDHSGTHTAEQRLWSDLKLRPEQGPPATRTINSPESLTQSQEGHARSGRWYYQAGAGMGATLNMANTMGAVTLVDQATWAAFGNRGGMKVLAASKVDPRLRNVYSFLLPKRLGTSQHSAQTFGDWLTSDPGKQAINAFAIKGEQVFRAV